MYAIDPTLQYYHHFHWEDVTYVTVPYYYSPMDKDDAVGLPQQKLSTVTSSSSYTL